MLHTLLSFQFSTPNDDRMSSPSADDVIKAFVSVVRDELVDGESLHIPDLGTFHVEHQPSEMREDEGRGSMVPPRDVVQFAPEE